MKKFYVALTIMFLLITTVTAGFARQICYKNEGCFEPSALSQTTLQDSPMYRMKSGETITVNTLATNFPDIVLYTTVLDSSGNPVSGLTQNDFTVTEKSSAEQSAVTETITCFSEESGSDISISLVFDVSGSMSGQRLADAKTAAIDFINSMGQNDRANLVVFSDGGWEHIVISSDYVSTDNNANGIYDIIEAINGLNVYGSTAVYDGICLGVSSLTQEPQPKAVIAFTDGQTNDDRTCDINGAITNANNEGTPVYTIGLGVNPQNLKDIAAGTSATYHYAPTPQDMADIYAEISQGLTAQYKICYTTHNPAYDGTTRTVKVKVNGETGTGLYVVNDKPDIKLDAATLALSSQSQQSGVALTISGEVIDIDAQSQGQTLSAILYYRHNSGSNYTSAAISLTNQGGGTYSFSQIIPYSVVQEPGIKYYLYAADGIQETYSPFNYNILPYDITVLDNIAPSIVHTPITRGASGQAVTINASITDPNTSSCYTVSQVTLYYRVNDPNQDTHYIPEEMVKKTGNNYSASIPADKMTDAGVDYFIAAWDDCQSRSNHGTALNPHFIDNSKLPCTDNDGDGYSVEGGICGEIDCDDNDAAVNPGAIEVCGDGIDNDCDGTVDDNCCTDNDGDGYGSPASAACQYPELDCDDNNETVNPGVPEVCDNKDNDCDGSIDEGCYTCTDNDGDGYGSPASTACQYLELDCDDNDPHINPGASEVCFDLADNNCDGSVDEGCTGKNIAADFEGCGDFNDTPAHVQFYDTSIGNIVSWEWVFDDGGTTYEQNPLHTYQREGVFTVSLTVTGANGETDKVIKTECIRVGDCTLDADFIASPTHGSAPLTVQFTDQSSGPATEYSWDFGDGGTSDDQNPFHTYNNPGTYTVTLSVSGPGCTDIESKANLITVQGQGDPPPAGTCAIELATFGRSNAKANADLLRSFRDNILSSSVSGKMLTNLYYYHTEEIVKILSEDNELKIIVGDMVETFTPKVRDILFEKSAVVTKEELKEIKGILVTLADRGSMALKVTMNFILDKMENESLLQQYGIFVLEEK